MLRVNNPWRIRKPEPSRRPIWPYVIAGLILAETAYWICTRL